MNEKPTSHDCGYSDGKPGEVIWSGTHGKCYRCGKQFEAPPSLDLGDA